MIEFWALLAQAAPGGATPTSAPTGGGSLLSSPLIGILLMIAVFYFIMMRGGRKDKKRHQEMLNSLQRNDRIQTIGGIIGTVVDVRDDEVVVKVDETNNTKMRFNRGAIKDVTRDTGEA